MLLLGRAPAPPRKIADGQAAQIGNPALFAFARQAPAGVLLCLFDFTPDWTGTGSDRRRRQGVTLLHDALSDGMVADEAGRSALPPYARLWLR